MRKILLLAISLLTVLGLTACGSTDAAAPNAKSRILVAYFSCTGNTKNLAANAAEVLGADIYEIKPKVAYTADDLNWHDETTRATVEQRDKTARPALAATNANVAQYDTIVIAYPIWWGIEARAVDTFMESYDFTGKTLIPICTSGGSNISTSETSLRSLAPAANWQSGRRFNTTASKGELKKFFDGLGI